MAKIRDEDLVLVTSFDELRTGMRVVSLRCPQCQGSPTEVGILGTEFFLRCNMPDGSKTREPVKGFTFIIRNCKRRWPAVTADSVRRRVVFRFAADLGTDATLSREENPYTTKPVPQGLTRAGMGTGGRR